MKPFFATNRTLSTVGGWCCLLLWIAPILRLSGAEPSKPVDGTDPQGLAYNIKTTVDAYEKVGRKNPKWDAGARQALLLFAKLRATTGPSTSEQLKGLSEALAPLKAMGCDDPMIGYLILRFGSSESMSDLEVDKAYRKVAAGLENSDYPAIRKAYSLGWSMRSIVRSPMRSNEVQAFTKRLIPLLVSAISDPDMVPSEADHFTEFVVFSSGSIRHHWDFYDAMEPVLTRRWPNAAFALIRRGSAYLDYAWIARGSGYANSVSETGWKQFEERIKIAETAYSAAWKIAPDDGRIPHGMMTVELAQGEGKGRMEVWFRRGMKLNPYDLELCKSKLNYLTPRWHGSMEELMAFGHECLTNTAWKGRVCLAIVDAHDMAAKESATKEDRESYWKSPTVWADIKAAYERLRREGTHHEQGDYMGLWNRAAICGQWQFVIDDIQRLPPEWRKDPEDVAFLQQLTKDAKDHLQKR